MNYELMSDFEINKAVAVKRDFSVAFDEFVFSNDEREVVYLCEKDGLNSIIPVGEFNPCNNPSDAWPIINDNSINIKFDAHGGGAFADEYGSVIIRCKNKLRAAMIVFLMINEG